VREDGEPLTELSFRNLREGGDCTLGGVPYTLRREGVAGEFVMEEPGGVEAARAKKPNALQRRFELRYPGGSLRVESTSGWGKSYRVIGADGRQVGEVRRRSMWRRQVDAALPDEVPPQVRVFVLWLVLLMLRRDESVAASG
jgi:hypothetical protein